MTFGQFSSGKTMIPGLAWARRTLRRHLDILGQMAAVALGRSTDVLQVAPGSDPARPMKGALAIERAIGAFSRANWAMRLIDALRAKLRGDLDRIDRGQLPDLVTAPPPKPQRQIAEKAETQKPERPERGDRPDRPDRDDFSRVLNRAFGRPGEFDDILSRPTEDILALIAQALSLPKDWLSQAEEEWESAADPLSSPAQRGRWIDAKHRDGGPAPERPATRLRLRSAASPTALAAPS